jgi:hypothetical protein
MKKDYRYPTETLFKEFNALNIKNLYFTISTIFIKKHMLLQPSNYNVHIRYAITEFSQTWKKKTACRKAFDFIGIYIFNIMPSYLINMELLLFKKNVSYWLMYVYDASKICNL